MSHDPRDPPRPGPEVEPLLADLEQALARALPGVAWIDRGLAGDGIEVELVGVDPDGRAQLGLLSGADGDATVLRVLDLLAPGESLARLLDRHLEHGRLDPSLAPEVVVLLERDDPRLVQRLASVEPGRVRVLVQRELRSQRATSTWLVPADGGGADGLGRGADAGPERFLEGLEGAERARATELVARLERVDEEVRRVCAPAGLEWRLRGSVLARLGRRAGRLEASVTEGGGPWAVLEEGADEAFLDALVRRYLELVEARSGDEPGLQQVELRPVVPGPAGGLGGLLTEDELEAFRD